MKTSRPRAFERARAATLTALLSEPSSPIIVKGPARPTKTHPWNGGLLHKVSESIQNLKLFSKKAKKVRRNYILSAKYVFKSSTDCVKWSVPGCRVLIACERDFSVYALEGNSGLFSFSLDHAPLTFTMKRRLFLNIRNLNQTLIKPK